MVPELLTERLILRAMRREDFDRFSEIWAEPEVLRYTFKQARSPAQDRTAFLRIAGSWVMEGISQWAICAREAPERMLGQTGFFRAYRGLGADFDAAPEGGWGLSAEAQGKGYGFEAAAAAHRWFDAQPFGGVSHAMIEVGNAASEALAARLGYQALREIAEDGDRVTLLVRRGRGL